jgi:DNA-directed RNA polymerase specialized sigma24 family protein
MLIDKVGRKVDRPARSEESRIGELYLRHADAAVRLAYLLTGDEALAEDLVQDAFRLCKVDARSDQGAAITISQATTQRRGR